MTEKYILLETSINKIFLGFFNGKHQMKLKGYQNLFQGENLIKIKRKVIYNHHNCCGGCSMTSSAPTFANIWTSRFFANCT